MQNFVFEKTSADSAFILILIGSVAVECLSDVHVDVILLSFLSVNPT